MLEKAPGSSVKAVPRPPLGRPFLPGQSGNPRGRPKTPEETKRALRAMLPDAVAALGGLLKSADEKVRLAAVQVVLNRVLGRDKTVAEADADEALEEASMTPETAAAIVEASLKRAEAKPH